ncbi:MAG: nucleoside phosphorylase [Bacteroidales bacterium]|nr:nucleoside phosphorylase [Bacteroidales bacterium]
MAKTDYIAPSELPLNADGSVYHLRLQPEQLADRIILVGDPGRVPEVSRHFDEVEFKVQYRELLTHTGRLNGRRISVISTGMGTDNIDIVLTELDALVNVDLRERVAKPTHKSLELIRIGTSGSLRHDYPLGGFCAATYGLGLDGLLNYYAVDESVFDRDLERAIRTHGGWPERLAAPYVVPGSPELLDQIAYDMYQGITATAPGFFGPQGRVGRLPNTVAMQNDRLASFDDGRHKIANLEMETAALYGLGRSLGHKTLTVCLLIANRADKTFSEDYHPEMKRLIETVLQRFTH